MVFANVVLTGWLLKVELAMSAVFFITTVMYVLIWA